MVKNAPIIARQGRIRNPKTPPMRQKCKMAGEKKRIPHVRKYGIISPADQRKVVNNGFEIV